MRRSIPLVALCAAALLAPAAASAQTPAPTEIDGTPLNTWVSADGGVNFAVDGFTSSEWFPYSNSNPDTAPRCHQAGAGVFVAGSYVFGSDDPAAAYRRVADSLSS